MRVSMICSISPHMQTRKSPVKKYSLAFAVIVVVMNGSALLPGRRSAFHDDRPLDSPECPLSVKAGGGEMIEFSLVPDFHVFIAYAFEQVIIDNIFAIRSPHDCNWFSVKPVARCDVYKEITTFASIWYCRKKCK